MHAPKTGAIGSLIILLVTLGLLVALGARGDTLSPELRALVEKAEAGDVEAQFRLGTAYDWGRGAPRDGAEAMKWYRKAAEAGYAEAQNSVGSGLQAEGRYAEALEWYRRAAEQDHPLATNNLAYLYDLGLGVPQDREKAFRLYSRAADLGWAEAMWNLAVMYGAGQLGTKDMFMACLWTLRARIHAQVGSAAYNYTTEAFEVLQEELGAERFEECRDRAGAWKPGAAANQ